MVKYLENQEDCDIELNTKTIDLYDYEQAAMTSYVIKGGKK